MEGLAFETDGSSRARVATSGGSVVLAVAAIAIVVGTFVAAIAGGEADTRSGMGASSRSLDEPANGRPGRKY